MAFHPIVILTPETLDRIAAEPFATGIVSLWNAILVACGELSLTERTTPVKPADYRIPLAHTEKLLAAWRASAGFHGEASVMLTWLNIGPATATEVTA